MQDRVLVWDGCLNVRDLGGLQTEDGRATCFRAVVRADSVRQLSDDGWKALVDYGVRTIVDLRFGSEVDADPPGDLPVEVVHIPVLPDHGSHHWPEIDALAREAPDRVASTRAVYREFLTRFHGEFARAVGAVAAAPEGGAALVHCVGGKDRTGLVSALLLRLASVAPGDVADDYGVSERNLEPRDRTWIEAAEDERERERRARIAASPRDAMAHVLRDVDERWGSPREYLLAGGLDATAIDAVRARLLGRS